MKIGRSRTLKSAKYLEKKRKRLIINIILGSICVLILLCLAIVILRLSFLQIKTIEVSGATSLPASEIQMVVFNELDGYYLSLIPKTSIFFYPKSRINAVFRKEYPKIVSHEVEIRGISVIEVNLIEREPNVMVCEGYVDDESVDSCFFADKSGLVYEKVNDDYLGEFFKYYLNTSSTTISLGSNFIDKNKFIEIQKFINDLNATIIEATGLLIGDDGSYELYIINRDGSRAVVYMDDRTPLDRTMNNLVLFWQNVINKKIGLSHVPNFEYINLRFGKNIFYLIKSDNGKPE